MTTADDLLSPDIPRDRWGRPQVPHPATGRTHSWTRATTLAKTLSDTYGLTEWAKRNVVMGMAERPRLQLAAKAAGTDRDALAAVVKAAEEAADSRAGAETGSALHRILERRLQGEEVEVPAEFAGDLAAFDACWAQQGLSVVPGWVERFVVCPAVGAAGTPDLLVTAGMGWSGLPVIADVKTGGSVMRYGQLEVAIQLAVYANATHWWDGKEHHPMPEVDKKVGLVLHMPAGQGTCTAYAIDLEAGWRAAKVAFWVREQRKGAERLVTAL